MDTEPSPGEPDRGPVPGLVEDLFRRSAGRIVSSLTRMLGPGALDVAEEAVQEALVAALQTWPHRGVPRDPGAWLQRVAHNRALDRLRRAANLRVKLQEAGRHPSPEPIPPAGLSGGDEPLEDDELTMTFLCCHPAVPPDARVALTLKTVGGLSVAEIAAAFLVRPSAVAQRLVRAKRRLRESDVPFRLPDASELPARLDSVLQVLYLLFNEGYAAHGGEALVRTELCGEAIRLTRLLAGHSVGDEPEVHALLALMLLHASRLAARTDGRGVLVPLEEQDRRLWDADAIALGLRHLDLAARGDRLTAYHVEAGIAACHAAAPDSGAVDWAQILELYDVLLELRPSPVVRLNRVVALARVRGPDAGLEALEPLMGEAALLSYYLLFATLADLRRRTGDYGEASRAYRRALDLAVTVPERRFLESKAALCEAAAARGDGRVVTPASRPEAS